MIKGIIFDAYGVLISEKRKVLPRVVETLELASQRYVLGLATSVSRRSMEEILRENGLEDFFAAKSSGSDVIENKPSAEIYLRSCELMGLEPKECVVVEDSPHCFGEIKRAGFCLVGILREGNRGEDFELCDKVLESVTDMGDIAFE